MAAAMAYTSARVGISSGSTAAPASLSGGTSSHGLNGMRRSFTAADIMARRMFMRSLMVEAASPSAARDVWNFFTSETVRPAMVRAPRAGSRWFEKALIVAAGGLVDRVLGQPLLGPLAQGDTAELVVYVDALALVVLRLDPEVLGLPLRRERLLALTAAAPSRLPVTDRPRVRAPRLVAAVTLLENLRHPSSPPEP
ncbi:hypothetical protein AB0H29_02265 [Streptomyces thermolilacinus]